MKTTLIAALSLASLLIVTAVGAEDAQPAKKPPKKSVEARLTKGYKPIERNGKTFYCREQIPLGTRLPSRVCYTMEQLAEIERTRINDQQKVGTKQVQRPSDDRCGASRCG